MHIYTHTHKVCVHLCVLINKNQLLLFDLKYFQFKEWGTKLYWSKFDTLFKAHLSRSKIVLTM